MTEKRLSKCCKADVKEGGMPDFVGGNEVCTVYHVCTECDEPCDSFPESFWSERSVVAKKETTKTPWKEEFDELWAAHYVASKEPKDLLTRKGPIKAKVSKFAHASARKAIKAFITKAVEEAKAEGKREGIEECIKLAKGAELKTLATQDPLKNQKHGDYWERGFARGCQIMVDLFKSLLNPLE